MFDIFRERKYCIMTKLETSLLDLLREDCRLPLEKLAVMTGATMEEVAGAIDSMEKRHIILRYSPMINWDLTDRERVEAMIEVRVTPQRDMGFDAVARRIYRFDEVKSVYLMSGSYDLLVLVEAHTLKELATFVASKLSPLEMVTGTATSFVLKRYKEEGVVFENEETDRRLVISP
jgi:DNA-binding Lrp family transcriptional regulator